MQASKWGEGDRGRPRVFRVGPLAAVTLMHVGDISKAGEKETEEEEKKRGRRGRGGDRYPGSVALRKGTTQNETKAAGWLAAEQACSLL